MNNSVEQGPEPRDCEVHPIYQGSLFDEIDRVTKGSAAESQQEVEAGYRGPSASVVAGISYRQLDYWARAGLVTPSIRPASGSGSQRLYSFTDIVALKTVKKLLDTGLSLQQIRGAIGRLRQMGAAELSRLTLFSDGATVYVITDRAEVFDILANGQAVFGIYVGPIAEQVQGSLAKLKPDDATLGTVPGHQHPDELAQRRARSTKRQTG